MGSATTVATEAKRAAATAMNFIVVVRSFGWFVVERSGVVVVDGARRRLDGLLIYLSEVSSWPRELYEARWPAHLLATDFSALGK